MNSQLTIMNANAVFNGKADLAKIISEMGGDGVVHSAKLDGKLIYIFGSDYRPYGPTEYTAYRQDTGNGYGKSGSLEIEGYAVIMDGNVVDEIGFKADEKRRVWVCK